MPPQLAPPASREPHVWQVQAAGQDVRIFVESQPLIAAMVADIRAARQRVWLESYIFADDAAGRAVAEALAERAAAGLDVRVMYDALGSFETPSEFWARLEDAGAALHAFHHFWHALERSAFFRTFNRRNHRKLLVVDGQVAYFGGMNLVDPENVEGGLAVAADHGKARSHAVSSGWRDVHVRLAGPAAAHVAAAMDRLWAKVHRRRVRWPRWPLREMLASREDAVFFFDSFPSFRFRRPARVFCPLIRAARRGLTLAMAYFLPSGAVLRELFRARRRGVEVRLILPGASDVRAVQWATRHMYQRLLQRGIQVYERDDRMLHGKLLTIDDVWTIVGSCNLDHRSLLWNLEFIAVFRSRALADVAGQIAAAELNHSRQVTLADCGRRWWWQRGRDALAWRFRRWL